MFDGDHMNFAVVRRHAASLVVAGLTAVVLAGCAKPEPPPLPEPADIPFGQGRLWQAEKEGYETSYLFGTLHVSDPRVLRIPAEVNRAFNRSAIVAVEIADGPDAEEVEFDVRRLELPEGTTLRSLIGARAFGQLQSIMQGRGYWKPRNDIKPWVMWDYLGGPWGTFYGNDRERNPDRPILDDYLEQRARTQDKEVVGLESLEESFAIFDGMPMDIQVSLLQTTLERYHEHIFGVPRVQFYVDGDLAMSRALWNETLKWLDPESARVLNDRLLDSRNQVMVERMLPLMRRGSTFVAVGAAHMPGEAGILRLLEGQGFTVTRLYCGNRGGCGAAR